MDVSESSFEQALLFDLDPEALFSALQDAVWCLVRHASVATGEWCVQSTPTANGKWVVIHELCKASAGKFAYIGWHTSRQTYRSWLDETEHRGRVQQELMRHASIQTTMNVYGQAMPESRREANGKVVQLVLKPVKASA